MNVRNCPDCSYKYPYGKYFKDLFFKMVFSIWECPHCKNPITFDLKRRMVVAMGFGVWLALTFNFFHFTAMNLIWKIVLILFFAVGSLLIFSLDTFKKP